MTRRRSDPTRGRGIGYGKPPEAYRFQPGQSGNPKGRPKGARGVATIVNEALDETIRVSEGGRPREMKKREAILAAMIAKAIKGDVRAAGLVVKLMETHDPEAAESVLTANNRALIGRGPLTEQEWLEQQGAIEASADAFTRRIEELAGRESHDVGDE